jgi:hypothetical protein
VGSGLGTVVCVDGMNWSVVGWPVVCVDGESRTVVGIDSGDWSVTLGRSLKVAPAGNTRGTTYEGVEVIC